MWGRKMQCTRCKQKVKQKIKQGEGVAIVYNDCPGCNWNDLYS